MSPLDHSLLQRLHEAIDRRVDSPATRARLLSARLRCRVVVGDAAALLDIDRGRIDWIESHKPLTPWDFSVSGGTAAWQHFWQEVPAAGWHDLLALTKRGEFRVEGDLLPFMTHLQFMKDLLSLPRARADS